MKDLVNAKKQIKHGIKDRLVRYLILNFKVGSFCFGPARIEPMFFK